MDYGMSKLISIQFSDMITPPPKKKNHSLFCNSRRSAKLNTVTKLKTKKNTVYEGKFSFKNKCVCGQKLFLPKTQKSLFLPYLWYGKAIFLLKKSSYQPGKGL